MFKFLAFAAILCTSTLLSAQTQISIDSVSAYVGKVVKVCDKVAGTFVTKGEKPVTYLNLGADYPNTKLTIVIFQKDLVNFPITPRDHYKGMDVCVTGEVGTYKDKVQIIAKKPEQIEIK
jgi:hypothetical protein